MAGIFGWEEEHKGGKRGGVWGAQWGDERTAGISLGILFTEVLPSLVDLEKMDDIRYSKYYPINPIN